MTHDFDHGYWQTHWEQRDAASSAPAHPHLIEAVRGLTPGTALDAGCGEGAEARWLADHGWQVTGADISGEALARAARGAGSTAVRWVEADLGVWAPDAPFDLVITLYAHPAMPQLDFYRRLADWVAPGGTLLIVGHLAQAGGGHCHGGGHGHEDGHCHGGVHGHEEGHSHGGGPGRGHEDGHGGRPGHGHQDGHDHDHDHDYGGGPGHRLDPDGAPPAEATVTAATTAAVLDADVWHIVTADERVRTVTRIDGSAKELHDVVVRAVRRT